MNKLKYQTRNEQEEEEDDEDEDEEEEWRGGAVGRTEMTPEPSLSSFDRAKPARSRHQTDSFSTPIHVCR